MHGGDRAVHNQIKYAAQGDDNLNGNKQGRKGQGDHGAADAACT